MSELKGSLGESLLLTELIDNIELTTRSDDIGRVLILTTRKKADQVKRFVDKILKSVQEIKDLPEELKVEFHYPPKRAGIKGENSDFETYANSIASSISEDPKFYKTHLARAPSNVPKTIPIEVVFNSEKTPQRSATQRVAPRNNPWNKATPRPIEIQETQEPQEKQTDMLEIMKKEMDKMWETKMEMFQKETVKAILEPLKEHTDKKIESLKKHLEEFIMSRHTALKVSRSMGTLTY